MPWHLVDMDVKVHVFETSVSTRTEVSEHHVSAALSYSKIMSIKPGNVYANSIELYYLKMVESSFFKLWSSLSYDTVWFHKLLPTTGTILLPPSDDRDHNEHSNLKHHSWSLSRLSYYRWKNGISDITQVCKILKCPVKSTRNFMKFRCGELYILKVNENKRTASVAKVPNYRCKRSGFDSRRYQIFWEVVGLERGPLSLVSTTEELLGGNSIGSGIESREYGRRDPSRWPRGTIYPLKLALTSPTSGGSSVGIVRSWTQATKFLGE
jgi:hypothetical protein